MAEGSTPVNLAQRLLEAVEAKRQRIVIIGDLMVDRWVHGRVEECQDGCPKFISEKSPATPGGADNARQSLSQWNVHVDVYGQSGGLRPIKTRFVDEDGKIVFRHDNEQRMTEGDRARNSWIYSYALEMVGCAGGVLLSDYDKGLLTPEFIRKVVELCQKHDIPCVADMKRQPEVYDGCILKCNTNYQHGYNQDLGMLVFDTKKGQRLVVTSGEMNPIIWDGNGPLGLDYDLPRVPCINHVGAGDCFAAHLTLALAYGFSLKEAAALAHSAGRVYVQYPHNRAPWPKEIVEDMEKRVTSGRSEPVASSQP